jgi:hypothetical protein
MEVAAKRELQLVCNKALQVIEKSCQVNAIVGIAVVRMGGSDHVGDAVSRGDAAHFDGDFPCFGAVVDFGQKMRMNVDHACI